ncbi:MAG TPA: M20 family metallopeptidase [Actinomycetota bacterium]|nr:M20 family metallopeptidase [Actinomycetota bacterium]
MPAPLDPLRSRTGEMLDALRLLVDTESPSSDLPSLHACAEVLCEVGERVLGSRPDIVASDGRPHVRWSADGEPRVLVLGHLDTVWPLGTVDRWPFSVQGGRASGPGVFDMKAGIVQALFAIASLQDPSGIRILFTSDEEVGAPTSRGLIEEAARSVGAVLVCEPSHHGALKVARKGIATYRVRTTGRAAHAGLEPEKGVNALVELAHQAVAIAALGRAEAGTTVTPTLASAGTAMNTVPAAGELAVDVRAWTTDEMRRVDDAVRSVTPVLVGAEVTVEAEPFRPPLEASRSAELFALARTAAAELGMPELTGAEVGGASDGNFTAALGVPTLDGLGAVGDGAHAEGEWIEVDSMAPRAALLAELLRRTLRG